MSGTNWTPEPYPPYTGDAALSWTVDLVWLNGKLFFTASTFGWARMYEITGGGAADVKWEGGSDG